MARLDGKVAIISGGARGMGAATSRLFVEAGARVVIADLLEAEGAALAQELGDAARFVRLDVTCAQSWADTVQLAEDTFGPVDVLVNNAGVLLFKSLLQTTPEDYRRVIEVNLVGEFLGIQAVARGMIERGHGAIVNISSVDGMKGANGLAAYASSKWGVRGLTKVAAMELGHLGIRVNSVHPGGVDTVMTNYEGVARDKVSERFRNIPLQRVGAPEEIARATLFLASDDASYIAGSEIVVDGGMTTGQYYPLFPGAPGVDPLG